MALEPRRLRFDPLTIADVPFQVLENAFWRPQAAKLHGKHKASLTRISDRVAERTYEKLRLAWRQEETWVNHALNALLLSLPDDVLGETFGTLCGSAAVTAPGLAKLDPGGIPGLTGDPDFVILGDRACILGESKVAARAASAKYSFQQFTKYQFLGALLACARDPAVRREPKHVLVAPELYPNHFCDDYKQWRPELEGSRLVVRPRAIAVRDSKGRFGNYAEWQDWIRRTMLSKQVLSRCDIDPARVEALLASSEFPVETYVVRWTALMDSVRTWALQAQVRSVAEGASRLLQLAYGPEGDPQDRFAAGAVKFIKPPVQSA